jgi:CheY-like chemotaxis protein
MPFEIPRQLLHHEADRYRWLRRGRTRGRALLVESSDFATGVNIMDDTPIRVLLIEDNPTDALLLRQACAAVPLMPCAFTHVERLSEGLKCLSEAHFDVVLLDLGLPDSQGLETFAKVQALATATPIVILTGLDDENLSLQAVRAGAQDYLPKEHIDGYIVTRSMRYAIERHQILEERKKLMHEALVTVKTLRGLLPICAACKKIRDDNGYWNQLEAYIEAHSDAEFTHGLCPECRRRVFPEPSHNA